MLYMRLKIQVHGPSQDPHEGKAFQMLVIVVYVTFRFRFLTQSRIHMKVKHSEMLVIVVYVT